MHAYQKFAMRPIALMIVALGSGATFAEEDEAARMQALRRDLATPDSRVEVGTGHTSGSTRSFGMYNGLGEDRAFGLFNLNLFGRDDATGTWLKLRGSNLGQDNRELRFDHERQGRWGYYIEASELVRHEPLRIITGLQGIGTANQTVSAAAALKRPVNLELKHEFLNAGGKYFITDALQFRVSARQDVKEGDRMYGRGAAAATSVHQFLAQPIDQTTRQWDASLAYTSRDLQLLGGYAGSSFDTDVPRLNVSGGPAAFTNAPAMNAFALPLDNKSHQFYLSGGYNFSDVTRTSFKLSRNVAESTDPFAVAPTLAGAPTALDGELVTKLVMVDLTSRPLQDLDLHASYRYEDRDDDTPRRQFLTAAVPSGTAGGVNAFNMPRSLEQRKGTLELGYQLNADYRLVGSIEEEQLNRSVSQTYRRVAYRKETDETQGRLELKLRLTETLNGAVAVVHADRGGSSYIADTYNRTAATNTFVLGQNASSPLIWADRKRDKLRLTADWSPADPLTLQLIADASRDDYAGDEGIFGPMKGNNHFISLDASYAFNEKWSVNAWLSYEGTEARQRTRTGADAAALGAGALLTNANRFLTWQGDLGHTTQAVGAGFRGKPIATLQLGADFSYSIDTATYDLKRLSGGTAATTLGDLPDIYYRHFNLKLFAEYALDRFSGLRAELIHDRLRTDDWTWENYVYNAAQDGTTVSRKELERATFVGVKYLYRWR